MKKKRPKKKQTPSWLAALKRIEIDPSQLNLKELRAFKEADRFLTGPIEGTKEWKYLMQCFRHLSFFGLALIYEKKYLPLSKCWEELERLFMNRDTFEDGVFVQSWIFCNFPIDEENKTVLDHFEKFVEEAGNLENFHFFINSIRNSRLGLYQEILSSKKIIKFRELFTGKVIKAFNTITEYNSGEIFLTRLIKFGGKIYSFADPKCWPKEYKSQLENMIEAKFFYFQAPSIKEQYEQFMKHAGPYWMSCVVKDEDCPILNPDHYLSYYE